MILRVLFECDGLDPKSGEERRGGNRNGMREAEEGPGQRETRNVFINDGEGLSTAEGNGESEIGENGNSGERRRGLNGNEDMSRVPMSALISPNTRYSGRSVRNGEGRNGM